MRDDVPRSTPLRRLRAVVGLAAAAAITFEIVENTGDPAFSFSDYLSYFTVQTNLFAVVVLMVGAIREPATRGWAWTRGAAALYLTVTGLVYAFLLAPSPLSLAGPWNNTVVHRIVPLALLLDWLLFPPPHRVPVRAALGWLGYPAAFLTYSLLRGAVTGFYPYDFLDPTRSGGYPRVAAWSVGLLAGMAVLTVLFAARTRTAERPVTAA